VSGTGSSMGTVRLDVTYPANMTALAVDAVGDLQAAAVIQQTVAFFDDEILIANRFLVTAGQELPYVPLNMRLRRGCTLVMRSTGAAAGTIRLNPTLGLFPVGMGQDATS